MSYRLRFNRNQDPEKQKPRLSLVYNADQVDAANQDVAFSPDNHAAVGQLQAIQEDGTNSSRPELEQRDRDGSVWLVDGGFTSDAPGEFPPRERVGVLVGRPSVTDQTPPGEAGGRDGIPTTAGVWESSGIIDVSEFFSGDDGSSNSGNNSNNSRNNLNKKGQFFLLDVQVYRPTNPPCPGGTTFGPQCVPETVEGGQLLFLRQPDDGKGKDKGKGGEAE